VVEVEMGITLGVGMAAGGGDGDKHHEGQAEEMGEDEWIDRGGVSHPFNDQMECILLCMPRDQSHIS
jgi:hypothetical protein